MNFWTIDELVAIKIPSDISISPDARQLAYIMRSLDEDKGEYRRKVYRQSLVSEAEPVQLTQGVSNEAQPKYSSDGKWLTYLSDRVVEEDEDEEESNPKNHLYALPLDGGEAKCLTEQVGPAYYYDLSPDGKYAYVATDVKQTDFDKQRQKARLEQKQDYTHEERDKRAKRICRIDIATGNATTIYQRDYGLIEFCVGPTGDTIVFSTNHTGETNDFDTTNLYVLEQGPEQREHPEQVPQQGQEPSQEDARAPFPDTASGPGGKDTTPWHVRPLVERIGACHTPRFSPDGRYVAYIAPRFERSEHSQSEVWMVPVTTSANPINVTEHLQYVGDTMSLIWLSPTQLLFQAEQGLYSHLYSIENVNRVLEPVGEEPVSRVQIHPLVADEAVVYDFAISQTAQVIAYTVGTAYQPPEVFQCVLGQETNTVENVTEAPSASPTSLSVASQSVTSKPSQSRQVSHWQDEWKDKYRAVVEDYHWKADDGTIMEGLLVRPHQGANPESKSDGKWPLIVDIHGGPAWHTTKEFLQYLNFHWLCQLGYAVFLPNYRGGLAYGQDYLYKNNRDLGGIDYRDIITGVNALVDEGIVDEQRMGVTGGSYGGYMTNWIIGHDNRFKAAVSEFGIWNLMTDFGCSTQRCWEVMYLGQYWENMQLYLERSPAAHVANVTTPTMIIHGDDDDNTFIANSKEMYNALLEAGKQVEFVHYPREGHGLREPRHKADELEKIAAWFGHFIPTTATKTPCKPQDWSSLDDSLRARFTGFYAITTEFNQLGADFAKVLRVEVELERVDSNETDEEYKASATARAKSAASDGTDKGMVPTLVLGDAENPMVLLRWQGTEKHQRASVIAATEIAPLGWTVPGTEMVVHGKQTFHITGCVKLSLLFPASWMEYGNLSETVLQMKSERFGLIAGRN